MSLLVATSTSALPLVFEPNIGQTDPRVRFLVRGSNSTIFVTDGELVVSGAEVVRLRMVGASHTPVVGTQTGQQTVNYFRGSDRSRWRAGVKTFAAVTQLDVYSGIDVIYRANDGAMEIDWRVAPGADPQSIRLIALDTHGKRIRPDLDSTGNLRIGNMTIFAPKSFQNGLPIASRFSIDRQHRISLQLEAYDHGKPLVIDPVIAYASHIGGTGSELSGVLGRIAVDANGFAYVVGDTTSADFPLVNAIRTTPPGSDTDAFVAKFNPSGTGLVYSTYLGGTNKDYATSVAVDTTGNAYITGASESPDFPTTPGAFQRTFKGGTSAGPATTNTDVFVTKLDPKGALVYSTYIGGTQGEIGRAIAIDSQGNAYIGGTVDSLDYPITAGAFEPLSPNRATGTAFNGFVTKLNAFGSALVYSTYLGGTYGGTGDEVVGIKVDGLGQAYVVGNTTAGDFPTTVGAYQRTKRGSGDIFVAKLTADGSGLVFSTFFGGDQQFCSLPFNCRLEQGKAIAIDTLGNAVITGYTDNQNANFPTTPGAYQTTRVGGEFAFVAKFNATGTALLYSTFLGSTLDPATSPGASSPGTYAYGIAVDAAGNAIVTGNTASPDFPLTTDAWQPIGGSLGSAFITKLNAAGSALLFSSPLSRNDNIYGQGGSLAPPNGGHDIALGPNGEAFVILNTETKEYPTANTYQQPSTTSSQISVVRVTDVASNAGALQLTSRTFTANEGTGLVMQVNRVAGSRGEVTVDYTTTIFPDTPLQAFGCPATDTTNFACNFTNSSGTVRFADGQTSATFLIPIRRDAVADPGRSFTVRLTNATGGAALGNPYEAKVSIVDDPTVKFQFEKDAYSIGERQGPLTVQVFRLGDQSVPATIDYATAAGTAQAGRDYTTTSGTLAFAANVNSKQITVPILDDGTVDSNKTLTIALSNPTAGGVLGTPTTATVTIIDNDGTGTIEFTQSEYVVAETAGSARIDVTRGIPASAAASFDYATTDGSAYAGSDYTANSGNLSICCNSTTTYFTVPILRNPRAKGNTTFTVTLSNVTGASLGSRSTATVRIIDADLIPGFSMAIARTPEREKATATAFDGTNFLVAIEGPRGYSTADPMAGKIIAQLVSEAESLVGSQIDTGHMGFSPSVAFDGTNYLLVWRDVAGPIFGQFISKAGSFVGAPFPISSQSTDIVSDPSVMFGGVNDAVQGGYVVVWSTKDASSGSPGPIKAATLSRNGTILVPFRVISNAPGVVPAVAFDGKDFLITWVDASSHTQLIESIVNAALTPIQDNVLIFSNLLPLADARITYANGVYFAVMSNLVGTAPNAQWDVVGQLVGSNGLPVGPTVTIASRVWSESAPSITFGLERFLITWTDYRNDSDQNSTCDSGEGTCLDIYGRFYNRLGTAVTDEFLVAGDPGNQFGSPTAFGTTKFFVAYNTMNVPDGAMSDVSGIFVRRLTSPPGDANGDNAITVGDVFYLINALFAGGPGPIGSGDANGDSRTSVADVFYLINYLFAGGAPPV